VITKGLSGFAKCVIGHIKLIAIKKIRRLKVNGRWSEKGVWVRAISRQYRHEVSWFMVVVD